METLQVHAPLLINTLGHSAGALIFAIFCYLVLRDKVGLRLPTSKLALFAGALAFLWNFASLIAVSHSDEGSIGARVSVAIASSAVSLLPAVLLQLSMAGRFRFLVWAGYGLSAVTIALHLSELVWHESSLHRWALSILTVSFGVITASGIVMSFVNREQNRRLRMSRALGSMSLFLFAMSFVHLSSLEPHGAWPIELLIHHAGIPLALFVLLQDYRSVFLDAFIRFLANILVAAAFAYVLLDTTRQLPQGGVLPYVVTMGALILYAMFRSRVQWILTKLVFQRPDLAGLVRQIRERKPAPGEDQAFKKWVGECVARSMSSEAMLIGEELEAKLRESDTHLPQTAATLDARAELEAAGIEVVVPLKFSHADWQYIGLSRRAGGRRYLSEDLELLTRLTGQIGDDIEMYRENEVKRLVSLAELRALQAQIHPHFLFNALNALYGLIPKESRGARRTVLNLADIFRYFLQTDRSYIPFEEELKIVKAYLEIEGLRLGAKLETRFDVDEAALRVLIPVLSVQPLVENAVRHGVSARPEGGEVVVSAKVERESVVITVADTGMGFGGSDKKGTGVGLENVTRRLQLCYGPATGLKIDTGAGGSKISFTIPVQAVTATEVAL